jgi:hypothetical protein
MKAHSYGLLISNRLCATFDEVLSRFVATNKKAQRLRSNGFQPSRAAATLPFNRDDSDQWLLMVRSPTQATGISDLH